LVLLVHNSHVNFQPFVKRREWFYQNISDDYNPDEILISLLRVGTGELF
jgi:hypothetical protein